MNSQHLSGVDRQRAFAARWRQRRVAAIQAGVTASAFVSIRLLAVSGLCVSAHTYARAHSRTYRTAPIIV